MSECLPYERFKWLENVDRFYVMSVNEKSGIGYLLEVDLEYPDKIICITQCLSTSSRKTCCF